MKWRFGRRRQDDELMEAVVTEVTMPTLARWYLYDTEATDPNKLATAIGLSAVSEEGAEHEREASKIRSAKVEPYIGFLQSMAAVSSAALLKAYHLGNPEVDPDELEALHDIFATAAYLSTFATLSAAFELGILENPGMIGTKTSEQ